MSARVLVVDDDLTVRDVVERYLTHAGYQVDVRGDGAAALAAVQADPPDLVVLDLMLPGMDGLEVCRRLRMEAQKSTPVLMLTARDALDQKLAGFESGADDYLVKPFALQELGARLSALGRRQRKPESRVLSVADLEYDLDTLIVRRADKTLTVNPTALKILQVLMEAAPAVVTRSDIETRVWGEELPDSDSLRVHIHSLRQAIDKPFEKPLIHTRHGIGYRIADPDAVSA